MDPKDKIRNKLLDIESHELKELTLLLKISRTTNPDIYKVIREPLAKIVTETIEHIDEFHSYVYELRRG